MSDHERWIVYPLLFLALATSLRDKLTRTYNEVQVVRGKELEIDLTTGVIRGGHGKLAADFQNGQIVGRGLMINADMIRCKRLVFETEEGKDVVLSPQAQSQSQPNLPLHAPQSARPPQVQPMPLSDPLPPEPNE